MQDSNESTIRQTTTYTRKELTQLVLQDPLFYPVTFIGTQPIHLYTGPEIPGEVFRKGIATYGKGDNPLTFEIWASNLGRIRSISGFIIEQESRGTDKDEDDYLMAYIKEVSAEVPVHRIVACIWHDHIENSSRLHVHHISNNGYDNRISNLLWVTPEEHGNIHHPKHGE